MLRRVPRRSRGSLERALGRGRIADARPAVLDAARQATQERGVSVSRDGLFGHRGGALARNPFGDGEVRALAVAGGMTDDGKLSVVVGRASGGDTKQLSAYSAAGALLPGWPARHDGDPVNGWGMYNENVAVADSAATGGRRSSVRPTPTASSRPARAGRTTGSSAAGSRSTGRSAHRSPRWPAHAGRDAAERIASPQKRARNAAAPFAPQGVRWGRCERLGSDDVIPRVEEVVAETEVRVVGKCGAGWSLLLPDNID